MDKQLFLCGGQTDALGFCTAYLKSKNYPFDELPNAHITHLLLDVPCKNTEQLTDLLQRLPTDITVIGGNLQDTQLENYRKIDLLQDPLYLAKNAHITAHCAVKLALNKLPIIIDGCPVLIIGWGRIGKCLASLLQKMGADVSIAARKSGDRAMATALGYNGVDISDINKQRPRILFNTVPTPIASVSDFDQECLMIELASYPGIIGDNVIDGRRLPGRLAPESSGTLIAESILRLTPGGE